MLIGRVVVVEAGVVVVADKPVGGFMLFLVINGVTLTAGEVEVAVKACTGRLGTGSRRLGCVGSCCNSPPTSW